MSEMNPIEAHNRLVARLPELERLFGSEVMNERWLESWKKLPPIDAATDLLALLIMQKPDGPLAELRRRGWPQYGTDPADKREATALMMADPDARECVFLMSAAQAKETGQPDALARLKETNHGD